MARLPANPNPNDRDNTTPELAVEQSYRDFKGLTAALRNPLFVFNQQRLERALPQSHVMDRLRSAAAIVKRELTARQTEFSTQEFVDYAKLRAANATLDVAAELTGLLAALDQFDSEVRAAVPDLFETDGTFKLDIVLDAKGRPVSKHTLTQQQMTDLAAAADKILARIAP